MDNSSLRIYEWLNSSRLKMMLLIIIFFLLIECFGQNGVQFEDLIFSNLEKAIDDLQFKALKKDDE